MAAVRSISAALAVLLLAVTWPTASNAQVISNFIDQFQRDFNEAFRPNASKPRYVAQPRVTRIETSLRPRVRPVVSNDTDATLPPVDPALAGNEPLMAYRSAILDRNRAQDRFAELSRKFATQKNVRPVADIHSDLAALPDTTEIGSPEVQSLLSELAVATGKQVSEVLKRSDIIRARQDLARAELGVNEARDQLLPDDAVTDETIAVLHDMLGLPQEPAPEVQ